MEGPLTRLSAHETMKSALEYRPKQRIGQHPQETYQHSGGKEEAGAPSHGAGSRDYGGAYDAPYRSCRCDAAAGAWWNGKSAEQVSWWGGTSAATHRGPGVGAGGGQAAGH